MPKEMFFTAISRWRVVLRRELALQPQNIVAQIERAMTFELGAALVEQITLSGGVARQTNFHEYRVKSTVIDEAGVPVVVPAIPNAVAVLPGKRLCHLPMKPSG
jgi:isoquinoline 1-oxidoreductase beta subunit